MDQTTTKSIIYISKSAEWIDVVRALSGPANLIVVDNPVQAILKLSGLDSLSFVFFESDNPKSDKHWIRHLRKQVPDTCFLILLKERITTEEGSLITSIGVNDVLNPVSPLDKLQSRIAFLEKHAHQLGVKKEPVYLKTNDFKLPLWKRIFDICFATCAIVALTPVWVIVALAIRLESPGKIIYQSKRVGTGYRIFGFYKFRSMYNDADRRLKELADLNQYVVEEDRGEEPTIFQVESIDGAKLYSDDAVIDEQLYLQERKTVQKKAFVKLQNDPRVTRVGRVIRKLSIDELPQLFNVLKGEMSVVGNRPLPLYEAELLTTDEYLERFLAPAGLTGLWQVEKRGQNSRMSPEERKQLDIMYAQNYSFAMDMMILLKTIPAMIQKEDV